MALKTSSDTSSASPSATPLTPEICVIGGGTAGLAVVAAAAAAGVSCVLVEQARLGGGVATGSLAAQALLAAARRFADLRELPAFGLSASDAGFDWARLRAHIREVTEAAAVGDTEQRFRGLGVQIVKATAHFADPDTVMAGDTPIKAARFIIATGSAPAIPLIHGLETVPVLTADTVFDLPECPQHLLIVGGGSAGVEFAQAFQRLGAEVTIVEAAKLLGSEDAEGAAVVAAALERDGVTIHADTAIRNAARDGARIRLTLETPGGEKAVEGTHLLVTAGRRPNTDSLDLAAGGVKFNAAGIVVDPQLRTSNRKVFAIGGVTGAPPFTQAATYHATVVARQALLQMPAKADLATVPRVTFSDPELAQVGLSEDEASRKGRAIRVLRASYYDNDRARIERSTRGHIKIVTDRNGRILGATIVGKNAGELIASWSLAVTQGLNIRAMADAVAPYPTLAEVGKRAALTYLTPGLKSSPMQRLLTFLRLRG
jgi:pyruvate/2-oxoglutarate dehydrogenase complex dihydrolipoamide dehydrogenase (E3) component